MIFVTVGTQLPFDRLIAAVNRVAADLDEPVIAQIGDANPRDYPNLDARRLLTPAEFRNLFVEARVVVGHAGIGTLLSAYRHQKPFITMPRRGSLGEHRNDHQIATARQIADTPGVTVVETTEDLKRALAEPVTPVQLGGGVPREKLANRLRDFIFNKASSSS